MAARLGNIKVWSAHFGAPGIDPKHLFVYVVLPRRDDVATLTASPTGGSIKRHMRQELETAGDPVAALQADWLACVSQQACDEEYAGNGYHFFK